MKRLIIRQFALVLALIMLLTLISVAEDVKLEGAAPGGVAGGELALEELDIGDGIELELDDAGDGIELPEFIEDPEEAPEGIPVEILGIDEAVGALVDEAPASDEGTWQANYAVPGAQADNDALADAYLRSVLPGFGRESINLSPGAGRKGLEKKNLKGALALYDALKPLIVEVAEGKRTSTRFEFDSAALGIADRWTAEALGFASLEDEGVWNAVFQKEGIDLSALMKALLEDYPYHLFWFDKTVGYSMNYAWNTDGDQMWLTAFNLSMHVARDYAGSEAFTVNGLPAYVSQAAANINGIISANAAKDDLDKLTAYVDAICDYVEYNDTATGSRPYGDPWQLVWIFDGNTETRVVCEGYAKGFKYLCDLSNFQGNVGCVLVEGMIYYDASSGTHMWNSVRMPDGKVYLVDPTHCDAGGRRDYSFFLKGCDGNPGGPYTCGHLKFVFNGDMAEKFGGDTSWLTYSGTDYRSQDPESTATPKPTETPKNISGSLCKVTVENQVYANGEPVEPPVKVVYDKKRLKAGRDYVASYYQNKDVGKAKVMVSGIGEYTGKKTIAFKILPRKVLINKLKTSKQSIYLTWSKRPEGSGYEVEYGLKSGNFGKTKKVPGKTKTSTKILKLERNKWYYVRVRCYKKKSTEMYYSEWSKYKYFILR